MGWVKKGGLTVWDGIAGGWPKELDNVPAWEPNDVNASIKKFKLNIQSATLLKFGIVAHRITEEQISIHFGRAGRNFPNEQASNIMLFRNNGKWGFYLNYRFLWAGELDLYQEILGKEFESRNGLFVQTCSTGIRFLRHQQSHIFDELFPDEIKIKEVLKHLELDMKDCYNSDVPLRPLPVEGFVQTNCHTCNSGRLGQHLIGHLQKKEISPLLIFDIFNSISDSNQQGTINHNTFIYTGIRTLCGMVGYDRFRMFMINEILRVPNKLIQLVRCAKFVDGEPVIGAPVRPGTTLNWRNMTPEQSAAAAILWPAPPTSAQVEVGARSEAPNNRPRGNIGRR